MTIWLNMFHCPFIYNMIFHLCVCNAWMVIKQMVIKCIESWTTIQGYNEYRWLFIYDHLSLLICDTKRVKSTLIYIRVIKCERAMLLYNFIHLPLGIHFLPVYFIQMYVHISQYLSCTNTIYLLLQNNLVYNAF